MKRIEELNQIELSLVINQKLNEIERGLECGLLDYALWKRVIEWSYTYVTTGGQSKYISKFTKIEAKITDIIKHDYPYYIILDL